MVNFTRRRIRNVGLTAMAVGAVWLWTRAQERSLGSSAFATGYLMLAAVLFLALYNVRKKLPFLPLGQFGRRGCSGTLCGHRQRRSVCVARGHSLADGRAQIGFGCHLSCDGRQVDYWVCI